MPKKRTQPHALTLNDARPGARRVPLSSADIETLDFALKTAVQAIDAALANRLDNAGENPKDRVAVRFRNRLAAVQALKAKLALFP